MLSHFHGDHVGGLQSLLRDGLETVLTTPEEWSAVTSWKSTLEGYLDAQVRGSYAVGTLDRARAVEMPYVGQVWDLFADGSVWLIPTAGHSRGQLAALLNTSGGPLLFSFDASHLRSNLEHRVLHRCRGVVLIRDVLPRHVPTYLVSAFDAAHVVLDEILFPVFR